jgi:prolyl-tRNA editing enzyme YbaK/EbsC (Cys-tRNA(Pro) deacylase)
MSVHARILQMLASVPHERVEHAAITSAAHAAEVRGTPARIGGKALVMKLKQAFAVLAVPGDGRIDGKVLRRGLGVQRYRYATPDELFALTGLAPGSVPPLGRPLFDLPLYVDAALADQDRIAFTLGVPTSSAVLAMTDYMALARPEAVVPLTSKPQDP